jgi:hypothetical protein
MFGDSHLQIGTGKVAAGPITVDEVRCGSSSPFSGEKRPLNGG